MLTAIEVSSPGESAKIWYKTAQDNLMHKAVLYTRRNCHLCDQAMTLIEARADRRWVVTAQDIDQDAHLLAAYGTRIPVLRRQDTGAELGWPMTALMLARFLGDPA